MIEFVLFDLDGTVTDPQESITSCAAYALRKFGIEEQDLSKLRAFIGPPLTESFREYYGFSREQAWQGLQYYREEYHKSGLFGNRLYDGMEELLRELKQQGKKILLATSKPVEYADKILEMTGVRRCFDFVGGNDLAESRPTKESVLRYVLKQNPGITPENAIMVGDRKYDVEGARMLGIGCVGVLYGYGSREELTACGARYLANNVAELGKLLREM